MTRITFTPLEGARRQGTLIALSKRRGKAKVQLDKDPFPVVVNIDQVSCKDGESLIHSENNKQTGKERVTNMPTVAELREQAEALGIDTEGMKGPALRKAVAEAEEGSRPRRKRSTAATSKKKAPPKKKAAAAAPSKPKGKPRVWPDKVEVDGETLILPPEGAGIPDGENPFRNGSNLHVIAGLLMKGGKRVTLAKQLARKVDLNPYKNDDAQALEDFDKRLTLGAQNMRRRGWVESRVGRGIEGKIKVFVPGSEDDPRGTATKGKARKAAPKKKTAKRRS